MTRRRRNVFWWLILAAGVCAAAGLMAAGLYGWAIFAIGVMVFATSLLLV